MNLSLSLQLAPDGVWREYEPIVEQATDIEIPQDPVAFRASVMELQRVMAEYPQVETPLKHYFAHGVYAREMTIPAGTAVIGKIHKYEHISVVSKGEIIVFTEHGAKRIKAPYTMVAPPGTKRAVIALTETIWTTFHATESRDLTEIEAQVIAPDYEELESFLRRLECPGA